MCVAKATEKLSPKNISNGNWISPAPPPLKAEKVFAINDTKNKTNCSRGFTFVQTPYRISHMRKLNCYPASLLALVLMLLSLPSYAGNIYRFTDENGVSTLSKTLPPYAAQQGYEILDDKTLRVIERVLTRTETIEQQRTEQVIAHSKQEQLEQQEQMKRLEIERRTVDQNLLEVYPSIQDLIKARDEQLADINKQIEATLAQQKHNQQKLHKLQQTAADQELSGQAISSNLNQLIEATQKSVADNQLHLERLHNDNITSSKQYEHDLVRLRELQSIRLADPKQ